MRKWKSMLLALGLAVVMLAGGCGSSAGSSSSDAGSASQDTASAEGTILRIASPQSSATLDPVNGYDYWYLVRYGVCETLMGFNNDMTPYCWLAESYETEEDQLTWHFTIRDDVTFSNGNKLTAEIAKGCIEKAYNESNTAATYFSYTSMETDGQVLTIVTRDPVPTLAYILADPVFVMYDCTQDLSNAADEGVIGTGPFVFSSFDSVTGNTSVVRNENYWNGDVKCAGIDFVIDKDTSAMSMSLANGEVDAAYAVAYTDIAQFEGNADFKVETSSSGRTNFCFLNQNGPLKDEVLRQAVSRALDREVYCSTLLNGQFVVGSTPLSSALPYGYGELTDINTYDVESAARLLDDAGYKDTDGDGLREAPDGSAIELELVSYTSRPEIPTIAQAIQMNLTEIGINVTISEMDQSSAWNRFTAGEYDMLLMNISMTSSGDPQTQLNSYFTTYSEDNQNYNKFGYSSPEVDSLMKDLSVEFDVEKRQEIIKQIEQKVMDDSAIISICYPKMNFVMSSKVSGVTSHESDYYWVSADTAIE